MKAVDQTVFHKAVDSQVPGIEQLLAGVPHRVAITGISSAGTRISWHTIGEPPAEHFEAADKMAKGRRNGDGFGIGVHGPSHDVCVKIADLVHAEIIALVADEKILESQ